MAKSYIGLKYEEFKAKFNNYFVHKKKLKALENYASVYEFEGSKYIRILKELLHDGFLDEQEESFLEYQIKKVEIDIYSWADKTKWLKGEMNRLSALKQKKADNHLYFDFDSIRLANMNMPVVNMPQPSKTTYVSR